MRLIAWICYVIGCAATVGGVALVFVPAGMILGGIVLAASGALLVPVDKSQPTPEDESVIDETEVP